MSAAAVEETTGAISHAAAAVADCADDGHSNVTENFFKVVEDEQKVYLLRGYATYVGVKSIEVREGGRPHFALHRPRNGEVDLGGENERSLSRFISGLVTFFFAGY